MVDLMPEYVVFEDAQLQTADDLGFSITLHGKLKDEDTCYPRIYHTPGMDYVTKYIASLEKVKHGKVATAAMLVGMRRMNKKLGVVDNAELAELKLSVLTSTNNTIRRTLGAQETHSLDIRGNNATQPRVYYKVFNYLDSFAEVIDVSKQSLFTSIYWDGIKFIVEYEPTYAALLDIPEVAAEIALYPGLADEITDKIGLLRCLKEGGLI